MKDDDKDRLSLLTCATFIRNAPLTGDLVIGKKIEVSSNWCDWYDAFTLMQIFHYTTK